MYFLNMVRETKKKMKKKILPSEKNFHDIILLQMPSMVQVILYGKYLFVAFHGDGSNELLYEIKGLVKESHSMGKHIYP